VSVEAHTRTKILSIVGPIRYKASKTGGLAKADGTVRQYSWTNFMCHGSVHRESMSIIVQQDATIYSLLYFCKLLYMSRVVTPPIIRSTYNCNYSIWHWSNRLCYLPLSWSGWNCSSNRSTKAKCSRDGLTSARCCNYSYMCS